MRNAKVLLITLRSLANEVAKNLVLAGIGSLTVLDPETVTEEDLGAQFFVSEEHVGQNRAQAAAPAIQKLNPRVPVFVDVEKVQDKQPSFFGDFDIVIATDLDRETIAKVNEATRSTNTPFYAAGTYGLYGYIFADLIQHEFVIKRIKSNMTTELKAESRTRRVVGTKTTKEGDTVFEFVTKQEQYCPFTSMLTSAIDRTWRPRRRHQVPAVLPGIKAIWTFQSTHSRLPDITSKEDVAQFTKIITAENESLGLPAELVKAETVRMVLENVGSELSPVAAVLGGVLAQDVINVLAKLEQPVQNLLVFDGEGSAAPVLVLAPQEEA